MTKIFALNMPTYAVVFTFSRFAVEKNLNQKILDMFWIV